MASKDTKSNKKLFVLNIMNDYYVYIYLDPRKPGTHIYEKTTFKFLPFYVGKGKGNRKNIHQTEASKSKKNSFKLNTIRKIKRVLNQHPIVLVYETMLSDEQAKKLEIGLIKRIGRADLKLGPLTNNTDGGEGISNASLLTRQKISKANKNPSQKTRRKMSQSAKNRPPVSDTTRKKLSQKGKGRIPSLESRQKMSQSRKGIKFSASQKKKIGEASKGNQYAVGKRSEESKKRMREAFKNRARPSEETKKKISEKAKGRVVSIVTRRKLRLLQLGKKHSEETRKKISGKIKGRKHTDEQKKKISESLKHTLHQKRLKTQDKKV